MIRLTILAAAFAVLVSCAGSSRGVVVMTAGEHVAQLNLPGAHVGDWVEVYRNQCPSAATAPAAVRPEETLTSCTQVRLGQGRVMRILDEHYVVAEFPSGIALHQGDTVERVPAR